MTKIIYYYHNCVNLTNVINSKTITHIHVASINFGFSPKNIAYMNLNNKNIIDKTLTNMWRQINECSKTKKIIFMIGGNIKTFKIFFDNYDTFYFLLRYYLIKFGNISGIDLNIKEKINVAKVYKLIRNLKKDFGQNFIISLTASQDDLETKKIGFTELMFNEIIKSETGNLIDYINVEAFEDFSLTSFARIIKNKFPPNKIVFGMNANQFNKNNLVIALNTIKQIKNKYKNFGGISIWEYSNAYPEEIFLNKDWSDIIANIINNKKWCKCLWF